LPLKIDLKCYRYFHRLMVEIQRTLTVPDEQDQASSSLGVSKEQNESRVFKRQSDSMSLRLFSDSKKRSFKVPFMTKPCTEYRVDMRAYTFGTCKCGRPQSAHYLKGGSKVKPDVDKKKKPASPTRLKAMSFAGQEGKSGGSPCSFISSPGALDHHLEEEAETPNVEIFEFEKVESTEPGLVLCHEFFIPARALADEAIYQDWVRVLESEPLIWNNRWAIVHNNFVYLYKSFDDSRPSDVVILDHIKVFNEPDKGPNTFGITTRTNRTLIFQANSEALKSKWMHLLVSGGYEHQLQRQKNLQYRHMRKTRVSGGSSVFAVLFVMFQVWFYIWLEAVYFISSRGKLRKIR